MIERRVSSTDTLSSLVNSRVGLIKTLRPVVRGAVDPTPPYVYEAVLANYTYRSGDEVDRVGIGKGETREHAKGVAVAEAIEWYCAANPDPDRLVRSRRSKLSHPSLDPRSCVLYSERQYSRTQFAYAPFSDEQELTWIEGRTLPDRQAILVAAILVYVSPTWESESEFLCAPTSNGLAAGVDLPAAILRGLYELVERDAFLITWMGRMPGQEVLGLSRLSGPVGAIVRHYDRYGIDIRVVEITTDIPIHVMMGIAIDRSGDGPAAVVGLGCSLDPFYAIQSAVYEVCQARPGEAVRFRSQAQSSKPLAFSEVHDLLDHSALFMTPAMLEELEFLFDHQRSLPVEALSRFRSGGPEEDLDLCIGALVRAGCRLAFVDVTTPDVAGLGWTVVRTIASELQPIHFGYGHERLGGKRLYEVPVVMGHRGTPLMVEELNPCPHPLA